MEQTDAFLEAHKPGTSTGWERRVSDTVRVGASCLAVLMLVFFLVGGQGSAREQQDLLEQVMSGNFGKNWRQMMHGASQTNQVQFQRMQAILHHVNDEEHITQPPAPGSPPAD